MCVWSRIRISFVSFFPSSNTRLYYILRLTIRLIKIYATAKVIEGYSTHGDNAAVSDLNVKEDCLYRLTGFIMCQFQFQNFKSFIETRSKLVNIIDNRLSTLNIIFNTIISSHHLTLHQRICILYNEIKFSLPGRDVHKIRKLGIHNFTPVMLFTFNGVPS
jgi:hypothetical protein